MSPTPKPVSLNRQSSGGSLRRKKGRSLTPPRDGSERNTSPTPQPMVLNRQSSGGSLRHKGRNRRASTSEVPVATKGRIARRSASGNEPGTPRKEKGRTKQRSLSPRPATGTSTSPVRLGHRRPTSTSPNESSPTSPKATSTQSPTRSPKRTQEWSEMTMRANLLKNTKPPRLDNSTTSWGSFNDSNPNLNTKDKSTTSWASFDEDIDGSDIEKPVSDRTDATKPMSERTSQSDRPENADLTNLLEKLRDPVELGRWKAQKEQLSPKKPKPSLLEHDKVNERASSRGLKTFLQRSKRGYGQQANLDGLSVIQ